MTMTRKRIFISSVQNEFAQVRRDEANLRHIRHAGLLNGDYYLWDTYETYGTLVLIETQ
jgi:hypothetical protein